MRRLCVMNNVYTIYKSRRYQKSFRKLKKSGNFRENKLNIVINTLASGKELGKKYYDHKLQGALKNYRECHIEPDLLLIYQIVEDKLMLALINIGSHSDLF